MTAEPRAAIDAVLERFLAAWQSGDAEAVASLFAPDSVYAASVGPGPGLAALVGRGFGDSAGASNCHILGVVLGDVVFLSIAALRLSTFATAAFASHKGKTP